MPTKPRRPLVTGTYQTKLREAAEIVKDGLFGLAERMGNVVQIVFGQRELEDIVCGIIASTEKNLREHGFPGCLVPTKSIDACRSTNIEKSDDQWAKLALAGYIVIISTPVRVIGEWVEATTTPKSSRRSYLCAYPTIELFDMVIGTKQ